MLSYEVEIIEGEARSARIVNPAQRLAAATTCQPEIDMERDVCGRRRAAAADAELSKYSRPYLLVEEEPGNVLHVGTLIARSAGDAARSRRAASELTLKRTSGSRVGWHLDQVAADIRDQLKLSAERCDVAGKRFDG